MVVAVRAAVRTTPPTEGRLIELPFATRPAVTGIDGTFAGRGIAAAVMLFGRVRGTILIDGADELFKLF